MLIKFKKPDPRAGLIARMDSSRGQQLIDAGAADQETEGASKAEKVDSVPVTTDHGSASAADAQAAEGEKPKTARGKK